VKSESEVLSTVDLKWVLFMKQTLFQINSRSLTLHISLTEELNPNESIDLREPDERIRATSRLVQLEGKPSTNSVLVASGGREWSALPLLNPRILSFAFVPLSTPPIFATCESSILRLGTRAPMVLLDCPEPYDEI